VLIAAKIAAITLAKPNEETACRVEADCAPKMVLFPGWLAAAEATDAETVNDDPAGRQTDSTVAIALAMHCDMAEEDALAVHFEADAELDDAASSEALGLGDGCADGVCAGACHSEDDCAGFSVLVSQYFLVLVLVSVTVTV